MLHKHLYVARHKVAVFWDWIVQGLGRCDESRVQQCKIPYWAFGEEKKKASKGGEKRKQRKRCCSKRICWRTSLHVWPVWVRSCVCAMLSMARSSSGIRILALEGAMLRRSSSVCGIHGVQLASTRFTAAPRHRTQPLLSEFGSISGTHQQQYYAPALRTITTPVVCHSGVSSLAQMEHTRHQ